MFFLCACMATGQQPLPPTAGDYFKSGVDQLRQLHYEAALTAFVMSAKLDPNRAETYANIGSVQFSLQNPDAAITALRIAIELKPSEPTFHTAICRVWVNVKEMEKALGACREGVRLAPNSPYANAVLLDTMRSAKRADPEIREAADALLARFSDNILILESAGRYYEERADPGYAVVLYERLVKLQPNSAVYHAALAELYLRLERDVDAVTAARRALSLDPTNPAANYFMGKIFLEFAQNDDAGDAFAKVVSSGSEYPNSRYYLALTEMRRGHHDAALVIFRAMAATDPNNFDVQMNLAWLLNTVGRYEEAVIPARKAVALKPKDVEAMLRLGLALFESAKYEESIPLLEAANRLKPDDHIASMFLGVARARQEYVPEIPSLIAFIKEHPADVVAKTQLIELLAFSRRLEEAEPYIQEVYKIGSKDPKDYQHIGGAYATAGKVDKALDAYRRGLAVGEEPAIYLGLATLYARRGNFEEASRAYIKLLELRPDASGVMEKYGDFLWDNGKRRDALNVYKRSLGIKPLAATVLFSAGVLSAKLGEVTAARQYLSDLQNVDSELAMKLERILRLKIWG
jgi:tetratricopeptide (TPR) repeat protein